METATLAGVAASRSAMYWLLAESVLICPDGASVSRLRGDCARLADALESGHKARTLFDMGDLLPRAADAAGIEALAVEYTRLFGGVKPGYGPPPPHESVHRYAAEASEVGIAVRRHYANAALDPVNEGSPPDHLGIEFKFLSLLCYAESGAWHGGLKADALRTLGAERRFLDEHVLQWAPRYCEQARAESRHNFYRKLAEFAQVAPFDDRVLIDRTLVEADAR